MQYEEKIRNTFYGIKKRCNNKNHVYYHRYGGRGIKNTWGSIEDFKKDMVPSLIKAIKDENIENIQIERKDNDGNYCKENCIWIHKNKQSLNRSTTKKHKGKCFSEISRGLGGCRNLMISRIQKGWTIEDAANVPLKKNKAFEYEGNKMSLRQVAIKSGVSLGKLSWRIHHKKMTLEEALKL